MEVFEAIERRRSIRKFSAELFPEERVLKAFEGAVLAPNSSNVQTWDFHWVKEPTTKQKLVEACLSQSAARTACHLVVVTADPSLWKRSWRPLIDWVEGVNAPKLVKTYYHKLIPLTYRPGFLNMFAPLKWMLATAHGLFRPSLRGPYTLRDMQEIAIKSAALAAENFVLAITAQGGASCMMEGFDECRVKRLLNLPRSARVVMVIGLGFEGERGTWGPRFRLPLEEVVHIHS